MVKKINETVIERTIYKETAMGAKSKTTAVLLAVFLSYWTFLYTYKHDAWKFWVSLGASMLLWWTIIVPIGILVWAIVDACNSRNKFEYEWR